MVKKLKFGGIPGWLPSVPGHKIVFPAQILNETTTVSELILEDQQSWNLPFLQLLFSQEEISAIQSIPLYSMTREIS